MFFIQIFILYFISLTKADIETLKINKAYFPSMNDSNSTYLPSGYKFEISAKNTMLKVLEPKKAKTGKIYLSASDNSSLVVEAKCGLNESNFISLNEEINVNCETINKGETTKIYKLKQLNEPINFGEFNLITDNKINYGGAGPYKCIKPNINYKIQARTKKDGKINIFFSKDINLEHIYDLTFGEISLINNCSKFNNSDNSEMKCNYEPNLYNYGKTYDFNIINYCKEKSRVLGIIFLGNDDNNNYREDYEYDEEYYDYYDINKIFCINKFLLLFYFFILII